MTESRIDDDAEFESDDNARVLTLTDGVVAIAMTLLALDLKPDLPKSASSRDLAHYLSDNFGQYIAFLIAFLLAIDFWRIHHRVMHGVRRSTSKLVSANVLFLLAITLLPLTTYLQGEYTTSLGTSLFAANILLMTISMQLMTEVIERSGLRARPYTSAELLTSRVRAATSIVIPVLVGSLSWVIGSKAAYLFFLYLVADAPARFVAHRQNRR